ncbi:hexose kinase [Arthrobacter sp. AL08]|uniref:1-phosphofructokinase family hexose kinase n=1 Tax=Micrococcaceae TaxID=1268 RepID=UPI001CFF68F3|nr:MULTISPECIES: hexose kinase [Micrococcaceae]MCB5281222.1 Tagatose-6-phosphate kinase [Arthrobacter sp. ES1]MDD1475950.1 hexose kinase [Arthrobacter sp. H16F315]MDI3240983.1 hexose kinase [Arthrobacter sp. AL05]MDI3277041.1 hexose kinase [Arthrobacter sp. AL08]MDJ0352289.1 hexose kinase [Pseudarthrobacter sp. PH31-O2]
MIVTLTANPSLDRTVALPGPLVRGEVQRAVSVRQESGGKGVNVSRALVASGLKTVAVLPGAEADPVLAGLREVDVPFAALPIGEPLRSNVALTEPGGVTTKINEPGPALSADQQEALIGLLLDHSRGASWVVLAGSLPPGVPANFYATVTRRLRSMDHGKEAPLVAVDSSGEPLAAAICGDALGKPDLIKPNAEELVELAAAAGFATHKSAEELEADPGAAAAAASAVVRSGVGAVLATLGSKGAVLVTADGAWLATHPPVTAVSTVGAGDSSLAGYLLASSQGAAPADCLRQAVAHGAAAASLPGSTVPAVHQTTPNAVTITALTKD